MAPMTRSRAGEGNAVTDLTAEYYAQRASAGLIVTEGTQVSPQGVGYTHTPGIHSDAQVEAWRRVTDAVHGLGGRIGVTTAYLLRFTKFMPGFQMIPTILQHQLAEQRVGPRKPRPRELARIVG